MGVPPASTVVSAVLGAVVVFLLVGTVVARRRGSTLGGSTIVRCAAGHVFTTVWLRSGSRKSIRLGWWRIQQCPVGDHWTIVAPVRKAELTPAERESAAQYRDVRSP